MAFNPGSDQRAAAKRLPHGFHPAHRSQPGASEEDGHEQAPRRCIPCVTYSEADGTISVEFAGCLGVVPASPSLIRAPCGGFTPRVGWGSNTARADDPVPPLALMSLPRCINFCVSV